MQMWESRQPRIVVGVDDSPGARVALRWALRQAKATGATIDAVRVYPFEVAWIDHDEGAEQLAELKDRECREARSRLHRVVDEVAAEVGAAAFGSLPEVAALVIEGHPAQVLVELAREADLLVVGSRGRGRFGGLVLGSVSQHCVERASCPTAVVMTDTPVRRIVVGIDGSRSAQAALQWAVSHAAATGACVDAVCAYTTRIFVSPHPAMPTVPVEVFEHDAQRIVNEACATRMA